MARQPLLTKFPDSALSFGPGFLEQRPKAASLIAQCIACWTEVELQVALLLSVMLKANTEPVVALYFSLSNERAKRDALDSIADYVFNTNDRALYDAIFKAKAAIASQRNDLAHGVFGVAGSEPEGVAWVSTKDRIKQMIKPDNHIGDGLDRYREFAKSVSVYSLKDIGQILADIADLHRVIYQFTGYLKRDPSDPSIAELYRLLWNEPLVQRFQSRTNENQENAP